MLGNNESSGLRDALITNDLKSTMGDTDESLVVEKLREADAVERLGKHLLAVSRRMKAPSSPEKLATAVEAVNQAISALGADFAGDRVALPAELLKGVRAIGGLVARI